MSSTPGPEHRHRLTVEEIASLEDAAVERHNRGAAMDPKERFLWDMFLHYPFRMRRIKRDMKWLDHKWHKYGRKHGISTLMEE